ncbi:uncharacterized protein [Triticum aestivum]|uniref:uncharacterized protein isoform X3 n=1 Tax=Triticum aestivum TaxID=4565 RepID=UPI001D02EBFB|nr:uncharacterized protein LOC123063618 isoform X3 [Triticum aestivum]
MSCSARPVQFHGRHRRPGHAPKLMRTSSSPTSTSTMRSSTTTPSRRKGRAEKGSMDGVCEEKEDHRDRRDPTPDELDDLTEPLCTAQHYGTTMVGLPSSLLPGAPLAMAARRQRRPTRVWSAKKLSMSALTAARLLCWPLLPLQHVAVSSLMLLLEDDTFRTRGVACDSADAATGSLMLLLKEDALVTMISPARQQKAFLDVATHCPMLPLKYDALVTRGVTCASAVDCDFLPPASVSVGHTGWARSPCLCPALRCHRVTATATNIKGSVSWNGWMIVSEQWISLNTPCRSRECWAWKRGHPDVRGGGHIG